ncbi:MAG: ribose-phosphate pyrophosphokinase-like domain-containing protein, partial [Parasporobacterium sp.]|nr:ribose-phosphate pyrophosphokinase-like domain-containing protein [Parasporobacterium sp.]
MLREEIAINTIPVGPLGIIPLSSCKEMGQKIDHYITNWRKNRHSDLKNTIAFSGYEKESFIISAETPRFGSGEAKGILNESIRGKDLFILVDVCNNSIEYS